MSRGGRGHDAEDVRAVTAEDVPTKLALSEKERTEREKFEPEFFCKAEQGAIAQEAYFKWQLSYSILVRREVI